MAEEAILKIVIVDEAARQGNPIPPVPSTSPTGGGPQVPSQPVPAIKSFEQFNTNLVGMTAEFTKAVQAFQQSAKQIATVAKPEKQVLAIEYKAPPTGVQASSPDYAGNLQGLLKRMGTGSISSGEVQSQFAGANLTSQEQEFLYQIIVQGKKYNAIAPEMGVHPSRISQIASSVQGKLGVDKPMHKLLLNVEKENKDFAANQQRMGQHVSSENMGSASMLDMMQEQEKGGQYGEKVPTWEKLMNRFTDAWMKESDPEIGGSLTKAMEAIVAQKIPSKVLEAARKAKSVRQALKLLGPHLAAGDLFNSEFGDDPDVPGAWMDESDFDLPPMAHILDDSLTSFRDEAPYSHYAKGGSVGADAMREYGISPAELSWKRRRIGGGEWRGDGNDYLFTEDFSIIPAEVNIDRLDEKVKLWKLLGGIGGSDTVNIAQSKSIEALQAIAQELTRDQAMAYALEFAREVNDYDEWHMAKGGEFGHYHMAKGGRINMTRGGVVPNMGHAQSGADWHPAWLTDNEFVMNAKSAARNRNALYAANADPNVTLVAKHYASGGQAAGAAIQLSRAAGVAVDPIVGAAVAVGVVLEQVRNDFIDGLKKATAGLLEFTNATAVKSAEYSSTVASAEALVEIRQTMGDFRRAQEAGPELARYLRAQGELQQKVEDLKIKLLLKILPAVTGIVTILEKIMPAGEGIVAVLEALSGPVGAAVAAINRIANAAEDANRPDIADPTDLILNGGMSFPPPE